MPNRDPLRTHLEGLLGASLPDYHVFQRAVSSIALQPQDLLFDVGIVDRRFFFVVAGILSVGIVQGSGREWIRRFAGPGELVSGVPPLGHPVGGAAAALHAMPAQTRGQQILTQYRVRAITRVNVRAVDAAVGPATRRTRFLLPDSPRPSTTTMATDAARPPATRAKMVDFLEPVRGTCIVYPTR